MKHLSKFLLGCARLSCVLLSVTLPALSIPIAVLAAGFPQGEPFTPPLAIFAGVIGLTLLFVSGFAMFAIGWPVRYANVIYRVTTIALLLLPLGVGMVLINASENRFGHDVLGIPLTAFTAVLLVLCATPGLPVAKAERP